MSRKIEDSAKQIAIFAFKAHRRIHAAGDRSHSLEDVKQELSIAWCIAVRDFDESKGVPFGAFLARGMKLYINRYIEKNIDRRHDEVGALSLDFEMTKSGAEVGTLADVIPSGQPAPSAGIEEESQMVYARRKLSQRAYQFVQILRDQPPELLAEVQHIEARGNFGKSRGRVSPAPFRLTSAMVFDLMAVGPQERKHLLNEVRDLGDQICRTATR